MFKNALSRPGVNYVIAFLKEKGCEDSSVSKTLASQGNTKYLRTLTQKRTPNKKKHDTHKNTALLDAESER